MDKDYQQANYINAYLVGKPELIERLLKHFGCDYKYAKNNKYLIVRCPHCLNETDGEQKSENNYARAALYYQNLNKEGAGCGWQCFQSREHFVGNGRHSSLVGFFRDVMGDIHPAITTKRIAKVLNITFDEMEPTTESTDSPVSEPKAESLPQMPAMAETPRINAQTPTNEVKLPIERKPTYPVLQKKLGADYEKYGCDELSYDQVDLLMMEKDMVEIERMLKTMNLGKFNEVPF